MEGLSEEEEGVVERAYCARGVSKRERVDGCTKDASPSARTRRIKRRKKADSPPKTPPPKIHNRRSLFPKPRHRPRFPNSPPPRQRREQAMTEHEAQEREQDNAVELRRFHELGAHHRCRQARGGECGVGEKEGGEGVSCGEGLERRREIRVQEWEEKVRRESEERGEEKHAQGRSGVDNPAEPDAHVLDFGHRGLGPEDKGGFRAGGGGEGDGAWKPGRTGELELLREGTARPSGVSGRRRFVSLV
ncbi:hypothetical protein B0H13DRAFT_1904775 [Mycena leptocephala]|nr:hypothetical protein B0H13DRAFT_1904775 [Mycena leptocephala]